VLALVQEQEQELLPEQEQELLQALLLLEQVQEPVLGQEPVLEPVLQLLER
jgi:hypothetical protein